MLAVYSSLFWGTYISSLLIVGLQVLLTLCIFIDILVGVVIDADIYWRR